MDTGDRSKQFQGFDMEKFVDKESLLDTLYTLFSERQISDKDYKICYKLNCKTRISLLTTVGNQMPTEYLIV